ncbi:carboxymuconolactone decarboxylase family protein [Actinopolyspora mortivallis]|uniref:carboxymuconolactone decarboxylase family protein n=1 Tax=Actinopolyspora mortivallis TaxID=33906 RepID=UPI000379DABD|nr:carboxymuconolactone decarboxylase family protein [Actinopolyspora mortivallis]
MPRIPVHSVEDAPQQSQQRLQQLRAQFGTVLNIHGEMAHSPVVLAAYGGILDAITEHGTFDAPTREAIALAVGNTNDCGYCQSAHTQGAKAAGWSEPDTVAIRDGSIDTDPKLSALLDLARAISRDAGEVDDSTWERARQAGWSETELTELFAHVLVNIFTNYFNHYARTELDIPAAPGVGSR